jgi:hypothetical protein
MNGMTYLVYIPRINGSDISITNRVHSMLPTAVDRQKAFGWSAGRKAKR